MNVGENSNDNRTTPTNGIGVNDVGDVIKTKQIPDKRWQKLIQIVTTTTMSGN